MTNFCHLWQCLKNVRKRLSLLKVSPGLTKAGDFGKAAVPVTVMVTILFAVGLGRLAAGSLAFGTKRFALFAVQSLGVRLIRTRFRYGSFGNR
jgi:hypothetical protein